MNEPKVKLKWLYSTQVFLNSTTPKLDSYK